jgi:cystathionine beta-lyase/cystathionine gamma-synthase
MTHGSVPKAQRKKIGVTDGLVRISVGLEDVEDLKRDLAGALKGL